MLQLNIWKTKALWVRYKNTDGGEEGKPEGGDKKLHWRNPGTVLQSR